MSYIIDVLNDWKPSKALACDANFSREEHKIVSMPYGSDSSNELWVSALLGEGVPLVPGIEHIGIGSDGFGWDVTTNELSGTARRMAGYSTLVANLSDTGNSTVWYPTGAVLQYDAIDTLLLLRSLMCYGGDDRTFLLNLDASERGSESNPHLLRRWHLLCRVVNSGGLRVVRIAGQHALLALSWCLAAPRLVRHRNVLSDLLDARVHCSLYLVCYALRVSVTLHRAVRHAPDLFCVHPAQMEHARAGVVVDLILCERSAAGRAGFEPAPAVKLQNTDEQNGGNIPLVALHWSWPHRYGIHSTPNRWIRIQNTLAIFTY